ncbi:hypothetical protein UlMin_018926 [Ulmus minor]
MWDDCILIRTGTHNVDIKNVLCGPSHGISGPCIIYNFVTFDLSATKWRNSSIGQHEWIIKQWEKSYYISAIVGANNGSSLVVMSKVSDSFSFKLIYKKWREGFYVTSWLLQEIGRQLLCHEAQDSVIRSY